MDADLARLLLRDGLRILDGLGDYEERTALALGTRLRDEGHPPELVSAVLTQSRLRHRARSTFGADAATMLFTPDALEQATRPQVADHHAARFVAAGVEVVYDLGCGIGSDALGLLRAGVGVHAVEADPATALLAAHNLGAATPSNDDGDPHAPTTAHPTGDPTRSVRHARAEDVDLTGVDRSHGVWFDPARRTLGRTDATGRTRRTFRLEDMTPSWDVVRATAHAVAATGAKLSPAFPHAEVPTGAEAEWVSIDGDLVECAVWWGPLVRHVGRTATVLSTETQPVVVTEADAAGAPPAASRALTAGAWLHEPDLALLQAGLVGALVRQVDGAEIAPGMGYVVSERATSTPLARVHRVAEVLPANVKAVKGWLRRQGVDGLTIKRRGGRLDPEDFRRRLGLSAKGGDQATLLLTVGPDGPCAVVLSRPPQEGSGTEDSWVRNDHRVAPRPALPRKP